MLTLFFYVFGKNMFSLRKKREDSAGVVSVGWLIDPEWEATFIWNAPRKLTKPEVRTSHAKGVSICPSINDHESRLCEITAPVDLHLRPGRDSSG